MWNYWCNIGIYEMLRLIGVNVDLLYIPHFKALRNKIDFSEYEIIIINDIVHGISGEGPIILLDEDDFNFLLQLKKHLCGISVESLFSYKDSDELYPFAQKRLDKLKHFLPFFSSLLLTHPGDIKPISEILKIPALWLKPIAFSEFEQTSFSNNEHAVFNGSLYPERVKYLNNEVKHGLTMKQLIIKNEDSEYWIPIIIKLCNYLDSFTSDTFSMEMYQRTIVDFINEKRKLAEINLIKNISKYKHVIHLPAFFKGCHPRVIQALQAGVTPFTPTLSGIEKFWYQDSVDCLYYEAEKSGDLAGKIQSISDVLRTEILVNGRERNRSLRSELSLGFELISFLGR